MVMRKILTWALCLLLTAILPSQQSKPPLSGPLTAPGPQAKLTLTEDELTEILVQAIDEAVAPVEAALTAAEIRAALAESRLERWEKAAPWAVAGAVALSVAAFFGGVFAR